MFRVFVFSWLIPPTLNDSIPQKPAAVRSGVHPGRVLGRRPLGLSAAGFEGAAPLPPRHRRRLLVRGHADRRRPAAGRPEHRHAADREPRSGARGRCGGGAGGRRRDVPRRQRRGHRGDRVEPAAGHGRRPRLHADRRQADRRLGRHAGRFGTAPARKRGAATRARRSGRPGDRDCAGVRVEDDARSGAAGGAVAARAQCGAIRAGHLACAHAPVAGRVSRRRARSGAVGGAGAVRTPSAAAVVAAGFRVAVAVGPGGLRIRHADLLLGLGSAACASR